MPKFLCTCGNCIHLGEIPNPNQIMMISDEDFDNFHGLVDAEDIYKAMTLVAVCQECDRLYIFANGYNNPPTIYKREV